MEKFPPVCVYDSHTITDQALKSTVQLYIYLVFIPVFGQSLAQGKKKNVHKKQDAPLESN